MGNRLLGVLSGRWPDIAGRAALRRYRGLAAKAHVWIRWLSAPFPAVEKHLPTTGSIAEIGCGHGLFSLYAALRGPHRTVYGCDIDTAKIACARAAGAPLAPRLNFPDSLPDQDFDAIAILDVLYLLDRKAEYRLLDDAYAQLRPGGVLLVKEMSGRPRWKAQWNRMQETTSVRILGITEGATLEFLPAEELADYLSGLGAAVELVRLDRGRVHPHTLIVARKPSVG